MNKSSPFLQSSIGRKQIVALTGLFLIFFLIGHLAGNFFIFFGPEAFNAYAKKLANLRPALLIAEVGLGIIFLTHLYFTFTLVKENRKARGGAKRYAVDNSRGERSLATRIMPFTGTAIFAFLIWHLKDFTFTDHHGARAMLYGQDYGLYGVVVNSFKDPIHSGLYVLAMLAIGFHLNHGIQSVVQTWGFNHSVWTPRIKALSHTFGWLIALGFISIPVYIFLTFKGGCGY